MAPENEPPELGPLRDSSIVWRVTTWGAAATLALAATVLIAQTDVGAERLRMALAPQIETPARSVAQADLKSVEQQRLETQRLEAQVRELAADRDRLMTRIVSLENNINDMTGSIKRQMAIVAATTPSPLPPLPSLGAPKTAPAQTAVTAESQGTDRPGRVTRSEATFESKVDMTAEPKLEAEADADPEPSVENQGPLVAPPLGDPVPIPPVRIAAAPAGGPAAAPPRKPELGVDLGGARTMEILNARWITVKANFGPMLEGMHPLVVHDNRPGMIPYRLIVGPIPNGAAAAHVCSRFAASRVTCRTTRFAGEPFLKQ